MTPDEEVSQLHENRSEKREPHILTTVVEKVVFEDITYEVIVSVFSDDVKSIQELKQANETDTLSILMTVSGFGQTTAGTLSPFELACLQKPMPGSQDDTKQLGLSASIKRMPDAKHGDENFDPDAKIILQAYQQFFQKQGMGDSLTKNPAHIHGFSEGAGIALSLAAQVESIQDKEKKENSLHLYSLTSLIDMPEGTNVFNAFMREVFNIMQTQAAKSLENIHENENYQYLNPVTPAEYLRFSMDLLQTIIRKPRQSLSELSASRGKGNMLQNVFQRGADLNLRNQLRKFLHRNSQACESLGENWNVFLVLPRGDKMFVWSEMRKLLLDENNRSLFRADTSRYADFQGENKAMKKRMTVLFPNAGKVETTFYGEHKDTQKKMNATHINPDVLTPQD